MLNKRQHTHRSPGHHRPETWTAATLKALAHASALGLPVALTFPPRDEEPRR